MIFKRKTKNLNDMKAITLILVFMLSLSLYGQHYDYGDLDTTIYNPETGQYWYRSTTFEQSKSVFSAEDIFLNGELHYRVQISGLSKFHKIPLGFYGLVSYERPVLKSEWEENGYLLSGYNLSANIALRYEKNGISPFVGLGYITGKKSFGVLFGSMIKKQKWEFKCIFYYSLLCAYEKEVVLDSELPDQIKELMSSIVVEGFDPNSWYEISFKYQMSENKYLGFISERFYGSRLFYQYDTNATGLHFQDLSFTLSAGRDFEFKHNLLSVGISMTVF